ncbi:MAG: hypothetical protein K0U98_02315 [Deltaproteobacteria bacterium]|nr:hypothetical protein [Deltaproteobacteria bacterium]
MKKILIALSLVALFSTTGFAWAAVAPEASVEAEIVSESTIATPLASLGLHFPTGIPVLDGTTTQIQYCLEDYHDCINQGQDMAFCLAMHCN